MLCGLSSSRAAAAVVLVTALCTSLGAKADAGGGRSESGNMPDLGYPEPYWYPISQGSAAAPAIVPKKSVQVWGDIVPGDTAASICKWAPPPAGSPPSDRGLCKTDISWITASANLKKSLFNDPVINYILRFQLYGACYRSTQVSHQTHDIPMTCLVPLHGHSVRVGNSMTAR